MQPTLHYDATARLFHWLTFALLLLIVPLGLVMDDLPKGAIQNTAFVTHESLGLTVLALTVLRFAWRATHRPPPIPVELSPLERSGSAGVHWALYLVLLIMPLTGYLFVTYSGIELRYFGVLPVPSFVAKDKPTGETFLAIHAALQWAIYGLLLLHIGAALHHHFIRHNSILRRMLPRRAAD
jgi:cytochrome b561